MIEAVRNAFRLPDLRRKLLITLGILVLYRLMSHIPVPGVNRAALSQLFQANQLLGMLNLLSGGALAYFSVMAMGVYPYITASIIIQLLMPIIPAWEQLGKEGESGRQKLNQYTNWLTVPLAMLQAFGQTSLLASSNATQAGAVVTEFGFRQYPLATVSIIMTLTAGTMLAMWLGQIITQEGIGNGVSIIIFGGIIAGMPGNIRNTVAQPDGLIQLVIFAIVTVVTVFVIVMVQEGQRRIPVQYGKRVRAMRGNRLMVVGGQSTHVPLRVNSAGMIPLIFASSMLIFPSTIASYLVGNQTFIGSVARFVDRIFNPVYNWYWIMYFVLVIGFTYFYTDVVFRQQNLADTLQKQGGFIPGIRPGQNTEKFLNKVLSRITLVGAIFLGVVAILPWLVHLLFGQGAASRAATSTLLISSTGLLIVVGVVLDTMKQLEAQLLMRHYEGFIRK
ncbi:MAG TPA: preprotein translocase subunit SecY [Anaerolineae bacterium]